MPKVKLKYPPQRELKPEVLLDSSLLPDDDNTFEGIVPPSEVYLLLSNLQNKSKALLAGGSLRDMIAGKQVSDWDIFTTAMFNEAVDFLFSQPLVDKESICQVTSCISGPDYSDHIIYVLECRVHGVKEPVQIIGQEKIDDTFLSYHPLNSSRVAWDGTKNFIFTPSFLSFVTQRKHVVMNADALSQRYIEKIKHKYKGWAWEV